MSSKRNDTNAVGLYLDLLKKSLTNTLYVAQPDTNQVDEMRFVHSFIQHYIKGPAVSMLPLARSDNLQSCIADVVTADIPGDLIETGVWRGGATIFMRAMLKALGITDRIVSGSPTLLRACRSRMPTNFRSKQSATRALS